jgi:hypothetical protein
LPYWLAFPFSARCNKDDVAEAEANPEDIDLGDDEAMEDDVEAVQEKAVPV